MYAEQIEDAALQALSNYEGDQASEYTGYGDDLLDFGGKSLDFASEVGTNRVFSITISNTTGADQTVILCPSYIPSGANVATDGAIIANLVGTGAPKTIRNFLGFIALNPTSVVALKIVSTVDQQLAQTINILRKSPFRDLEAELINLASFSSEYAQNSKMLTVRRAFQLDNQTEVNVIVPSTAVTTFTFYCGAVLNTSSALSSKSKRAGKNIKVATARNMMAGK